MVSVHTRQQQVILAWPLGLSEHRASTLLKVSRFGVRYFKTRAATDDPAVARMKELVLQYPRYWYRRIQVFMIQDGFEMINGRTWRLWSQSDLQVPRKRPRRRVGRSRPRPLAPEHIDQVRSYDFVFDACANDQPINCLTVVDEYTRKCLAIYVAASIRSRRVIDVLSKLFTHRGAPRYLRSDSGP